MSNFKQINLAIIGCGRWGYNHVKTAYQLLGSNLKLVCDSDKDVINKIREISPAISLTTDYNDLFDDEVVNCVIIATPPGTHYKIAKKCLENGKHVLVEKPITLIARDAKDLLRIARENNKILMVGHVLLYHPAVMKIKQEIERGRIGKIHYIYSNRLNLGTVRSEENILWSFAPHDISVIQYLTESYPIYVDAKGTSFLQHSIEDTTLTYLVYPNNIHAHIFVSWLHPFKEHRLIIVGSRGMIVFEDSSKQDKLKFYPNGFKDNDGHYVKFEGEYETITYDDVPPLTNEHKNFYKAIIKNTQPLADGQHAAEVLDILEKAQSKLRKYEQ